MYEVTWYMVVQLLLHAYKVKNLNLKSYLAYILYKLVDTQTNHLIPSLDASEHLGFYD